MAAEAESVPPGRGAPGRAARVGAGVLLVAGGLAAAISALLTYATLEAPALRLVAESARGIDTVDGKLFLGVGGVLVSAGATVLAVRSSGPRTAAAAVAVIGSAVVVALSIVDIRGTEADVLEEIPAAVREAVSVSVGVGLYVALAGGAVAAAGSVLALFAPRQEPSAYQPPATGG